MIIIMIILASTFSQQASSLGHFVVTLDMFELQHLAWYWESRAFFFSKKENKKKKKYKKIIKVAFKGEEMWIFFFF